MALQLQGTAKVKVPEDAKPGDEIEVTTEFSAEQGPVDRLIADRIARDRKEDQAKLKELEAKLKDKEGKEGESAVLQNQLTQLNEKLAASELLRRVDEALRAAGAADLEAEFRGSIRVAATDDDGAIADAVKAAVKRKEEFVKKYGGGTTKIEDGKGGTGILGAGGSPDNTPEGKKLADLVGLVKRMNPGLMTYIDRAADAPAKIKLMESYKAQGLLEPKKK